MGGRPSAGCEPAQQQPQRNGSPAFREDRHRFPDSQDVTQHLANCGGKLKALGPPYIGISTTSDTTPT
eukprot:699209-Lingulodinium_polyedra.AAC.1